MALTLAQRTVKEGGTIIYTTTLQDTSSVAVASAAIVTLTLTLYDYETGTKINSRDAQDVNGTNGVTIHATSGLLTWTAKAADNALVGTPVQGELEYHIALFEMIYDTDKSLNWEVPTYVKQHTNV